MIESWLRDPSNVKSRSGDDTGKDVSKNTYYKALNAVCQAYIPGDPVIEYYQNRMHEINEDAKEIDAQQDLTNMECARWPSPPEIIKNQRMLWTMTVLCPMSFYWFSRYLLYLLYVSMMDHCVFRLDVVYKTFVKHRGNFDITDANYDQLNFIRYDDKGSCLVMNDYKTSDTHGTREIELSPVFHMMLMTSLNRFPRTWLFPDSNGEQMKQGMASRFVKTCWIADERENKPTADDIRTSLTTRFFILNDTYLKRDMFARNSLVTKDNMEFYYHKINDVTKRLVLDDMEIPITQADGDRMSKLANNKRLK